MGSRKRTTLKNPRQNFNFFMGVLGIATLLIFYYIFHQTFQIKKITCVQNNEPCLTSTLEQLATVQNKSLFFTDLQKELPKIKFLQIRKRLPHEWVIEVSVEGNSFYKLDEQKIIRTANQSTLDPQLDYQIELLLKTLEKQNFSYQHIKLTDNVLIVIFDKDSLQLQALIDPEKIETGVYRLQKIVDQLDIKEVDLGIKEIDTRFKLVVLRTKTSF